MNSILKVLPQKQLSLQGLRKGQSISNNVKKDGQKSYRKTIKIVQWTRGKGHEGLIVGEGQMHTAARTWLSGYAVHPPSTLLTFTTTYSLR